MLLRAKKYFLIAVKNQAFLGPTYGFILFLLTHGECQEACALIDSALKTPGLSKEWRLRLNSLLRGVSRRRLNGPRPLSGATALAVATAEVSAPSSIAAPPAAAVVVSEPQGFVGQNRQ